MADMHSQAQTFSGTSQISPARALRASIFYFVQDPALYECADASWVWHEDGLLVVQDGKIAACGDYAALLPQMAGNWPQLQIEDWRGHWIMPGLIDTHTHYPQSEMIASPASGLLPWLETWTFPTEAQFAEETHAQRVADFFLDQLLANGTTTAMVYCTVHPQSVDAFFSAAAGRNARMIAGKVLMDRNCPPALQDCAEQGVRESADLIAKWHGKGRALYAITPRFAPTSTPAQLQLAGELATAHPDVYVQTHVAENQAEVAWVRELFPEARSYLDVYARHQLLGPRTMLGHGIWYDSEDRVQLAEYGAGTAVCPSSNLFLGSGLFDFAQAEAAQLSYTLACDVGGGNSFSMLRTMQDAYKVARLKECYLPALKMFYLATLGAARSLHLQDKLGSLEVGKEADFIMIDPQATPLLKNRFTRCGSVAEVLFMLALLGDDRCIAATWLAGICQHQRDLERRVC